jgi:hypothetical protein
MLLQIDDILATGCWEEALARTIVGGRPWKDGIKSLRGVLL